MKRFALFTLFVLFLTACTAENAPSTDTPPVPLPAATPMAATPAAPVLETEMLQANLPRQAPAVDDAQIEQLVQGNNQFAFDLYQAIRAASDENLIYSPYSISLAFSMVYAGARGQTEAEIAQVLRFLPQEVHHLAFNALDQRLAALGENGDEEGENGRFQLNIANAVWGQIGLPFADAYLAILAEQYGAGLRASDFGQQPEETRQEINEWVAEQTAERIQDILPPGVIHPDTRLVLANAIYFHAAWQFPFNADVTQEGEFALLDGRQITVPLMQQSGTHMLYAAGSGYEAVILPYAGDTVQMMLILPEAGQFAAVETALSAEFLNQVRSQTQLRDVSLTMPRFEFDTNLSLKELLTGMGMQTPFSQTADFSGIAAESNLFISDALHQGTITVDEEGTEAAAATVIIVGVTSLVETVEVIVDRPFIFTIMDQQTGAILFLGRVLNPA